MITIKSKKQSYGVKLPTDISEITPEVLDELTKDIIVPNYYCIVGLCFKTKLFDLCTMIKQSKNTEVSVTSIIAKISNKDREELNAEIGDKIIIERSSLERGTHININTAINSINIRRYLNDDSELVKEIISSNDKMNNVIIMEFKIIPISEIRAVIHNHIHKVDPFIIKNKVN